MVCDAVLLRLFDWKRAKNLSAKFTNLYRALLPPLTHLPDATGVKYCLQLNIYRFMLQKYYGQLVSAMFIVCLHPELTAPWVVYPVPIMEAEVEEIMALQRQDVCECEIGDENAAPDAPDESERHSPPQDGGGPTL